MGEVPELRASAFEGREKEKGQHRLHTRDILDTRGNACSFEISGGMRATLRVSVIGPLRTSIGVKPRSNQG